MIIRKTLPEKPFSGLDGCGDSYRSNPFQSVQHPFRAT